MTRNRAVQRDSVFKESERHLSNYRPPHCRSIPRNEVQQKTVERWKNHEDNIDIGKKADDMFAHHPSMEVLKKQREATAAVRDVWHQQQLQRKAALRQGTIPSFSSRPNTTAERSKSCNYSQPRQQRLLNRQRHTKSAVDVIKRLPVQPIKFDALSRVNPPLPKAFGDPIPTSKDYKRRPEILEGWKNEIRKVVPERLPFAVESKVETPNRDWAEDDAYPLSSETYFYKVQGNAPARHFIIDPKWFSEQHSFKNFSKQYQTCTLRFGWG
ncbi:unnamed protein product [Owenia fusiformis]|uniref:Uncharacterized protein n=1 Tax=Owenia fusiformis TaxID=6347 RepID=A0A8J1TVC9_OWEFU|nr:unnamed protein product [Owenia fusiformis]